MTAKYEHDDIARIAYRSWLDRGQPEGSPEIDWYYALSVVTNPEEVRPVPFGNFDSHEEDEQLLRRSDAAQPDGAQSGSRQFQKSSLDAQGPLDGQGIRTAGMQDEGMRNDTDLASIDRDDNEVTRRSDQFSVDQQVTPTRPKKKSADSKDKQSARAR